MGGRFFLWIDDFLYFFEREKTMTKTKTARYFWLAINGPSVAISSIPLSTKVSVSPTPELLIGFEDFSEAKKIQHFLLTAKIRNVNKYIQTIPQKLKSNEVQHVIQPKKPEPCSHTTLWSEK